MNHNSLKYFIILLLTICSLNASNSYSQETIKLNSLTTNNLKTKLKLNTENEFSVFLFNRGTFQKYYPNIQTTDNLNYEQVNFLNSRTSLFEYKKNNSSFLTFSLGLATALGTKKYSYHFGLNYKAPIFSFFYLSPQFDLYPEPRYKNSTLTNLSLTVLAKIKVLRNKLNIFLGGGGFLFLPIGIGIPVGLIAHLNFDYSVTEDKKIGIELKHPNYLRSTFRDNPILLFSLSYSLIIN